MAYPLPTVPLTAFNTCVVIRNVFTSVSYTGLSEDRDPVGLGHGGSSRHTRGVQCVSVDGWVDEWMGGWTDGRFRFISTLFIKDRTLMTHLIIKVWI